MPNETSGAIIRCAVTGRQTGQDTLARHIIIWPLSGPFLQGNIMRNKIAAVAAACALGMILTAAPAVAHSGHKPAPSPSTVVASQLISPLKVAFGSRGSLLVAESFVGQLSKFTPSGEKSTLVNAPGQEIAGVSYSNGTTYYFNNDQSASPEPTGELLPARLMKMDKSGTTREIVDLSTVEAAKNPDGKIVYGVRSVSPECLAQAPYLQSSGEVFSHPYATAPARNGVYVADAGANTIWFVSDSGWATVVKVIPAQPVTIDAAFVAIAAEMGMSVPDCMMGLKYYAQAVPTDIEIHGNWLYYSILPGVPGESLGMGKVFRTHMFGGQTQLLAQNLAAPTGVAVDRNNNVYVAELFGGGVSVIKNGHTRLVLPAAMASDVDISGNTMAVLTEALNEQTGGNLITQRIR